MIRGIALGCISWVVLFVVVVLVIAAVPALSREWAQIADELRAAGIRVP